MAIKHNEEFKREAVHIALSSGLPRRQVAADLGVGLSALGKWVSLRRPDDRRAGLDDDLASENERLRRENRVLRIKKGAAVFFASQKPGTKWQTCHEC
ncbi:MAG: transposase [Alphaproteobacteria bacterium]|nr:transposase [Alphaproteobacteria bacterium]